jgi:thiosulfate dehydrogenase
MNMPIEDESHNAEQNSQGLPKWVAGSGLMLVGAVVGLAVIMGWAWGGLNGTRSHNVLPPQPDPAAQAHPASVEGHTVWHGPDTTQWATLPNGQQIRYGYNLIAHTARYIGPQGSVSQAANGMNCQNCHLRAGTMPFGNNYGAVASTYPRFRARSGTEEDIPKRVNDCFQRSLNGDSLPIQGAEMQAIVAYINWLGQDVPRGKKPVGSGIYRLVDLDRPASPSRGAVVYQMHCASCHGPDGQGQRQPGEAEYQYPPLWGPNSYNDAAGLYRLSNLAGYTWANMPFGTTAHTPTLTQEQAWDVAAFINSQPRPHVTFAGDWPNVSKKPVDHPFGPFADPFPETQHKYGPFGPIRRYYENHSETASAAR